LSKNHAAPKPVLSCPILILLSRPRYVPHETEKESFLQKKSRHGIPGRAASTKVGVLHAEGEVNEIVCLRRLGGGVYFHNFERRLKRNV